MEGYTRLPENVQFLPLFKIVNPGDVFIIGPTVQNEQEQVENGSNRAWRIMGGMAVFLIFWFWLIFQVNSSRAA